MSESDDIERKIREHVLPCTVGYHTDSSVDGRVCWDKDHLVECPAHYVHAVAAFIREREADMDRYWLKERSTGEAYQAELRASTKEAIARCLNIVTNEAEGDLDFAAFLIRGLLKP